MTDSLRKRSWLKAIREAAREQQVPLPAFSDCGMGTAICRSVTNRRFVSFKRRLVSAADAPNDGVEWTLWLQKEDHPTSVAVFREPLAAPPERVAAVLSILRGWLVDDWPVETAEQFAASHTTNRVERIALPQPPRQEYWFSSEHAIGIVIENNQWAIRSQKQTLSVWRAKNDTSRGDRLPLEDLDRLCLWLARQWSVIAYGNDVRPDWLRNESVAACYAYDLAQFLPREEREELNAWWDRHAIRAASGELPNIFLERQADELVVSWDASPSSTRFYSIPSGEEILPVRFAVPVLRQVVQDRLKVMSLQEAERTSLLASTSEDVENAYIVLAQYKINLSKKWLRQIGFSDDDAGHFVIAGTSRHPIVGLLRTSQGKGSPIFTEDYEKVLRLLRPSTSQSYQRLREVARGISETIDSRTPWESGYRLASLVREKLNKTAVDPLDEEAEIRSMGIDIHTISLNDTKILGACIGSPAFAPLIVLNQSCPDASGPSGRRITLAHELCHLLFDRSRMQNLARFEGAEADSDRLIEMRANAFAVELLVPRSTLIKEDGTVPTAEELNRIAFEHQVSLTALSRHAENLKARLAHR